MFSTPEKRHISSQVWIRKDIAKQNTQKILSPQQEHRTIVRSNFNSCRPGFNIAAVLYVRSPYLICAVEQADDAFAAGIFADEAVALPAITDDFKAGQWTI